MKRYQVYLNPQSISLIDELGEHIDMSRSKIIQMAIDTVADNLRKMFVATQTPVKRTLVLDSLVGSIKIKGGKKTNLALNINELYLRD